MTSPEDVALAVAAGADAVGIIVSASARRIAATALERILDAVPPFVTAVVVSAGETDVDLAALAARGIVLQFSGDEPAAFCERLTAGRPYVKAFHVRAEDGRATFDLATPNAYARAMPLVDSSLAGAYGGTGRTFDWEIAASLARERPTIVSGGLTPGNVAACIAVVRPYAVDVRGGIETSDRKDPAKMRAFVLAVREADALARTGPASVVPNG